MLMHKSFNIVDVSAPKTMISLKGDWMKPEFGFILTCFDMDMSRFFVFVAI